jgi:hypothetical protein
MPPKKIITACCNSDNAAARVWLYRPKIRLSLLLYTAAPWWNSENLFLWLVLAVTEAGTKKMYKESVLINYMHLFLERWKFTGGKVQGISIFNLCTSWKSFKSICKSFWKCFAKAFESVLQKLWIGPWVSFQLLIKFSPTLHHMIYHVYLGTHMTNQL